MSIKADATSAWIQDLIARFYRDLSSPPLPLCLPLPLHTPPFRHHVYTRVGHSSLPTLSLP